MPDRDGTKAETFTTPLGPVRYFDEYGEVTREVSVLKEILAALKRIEELLQKPEQK